MTVRWWSVLGAVAFGAVGFLLAASANTAAGTDLRSDTQAIKDVVAERAAIVDQRQTRVTELQDTVAALTKEQEGTQAARAQGVIDRLAEPVGLIPLTGPGVSVSLTDAPQKGNEEANPDDLVVHQQDLQAVINAMWRGGAQGIQVMDQRLINTSAVRCVGNTLILQGRVYSPPFVVIGVGDQAAIERELENDEYLRGYQAAVDFFGLGWEQSRLDSVTLPAFDGPIDVNQATPITKENRP
jgi:uncharacterized protein YlxW (UPF0749 family)